jgi:hypothetical protein
MRGEQHERDYVHGIGSMQGLRRLYGGIIISSGFALFQHKRLKEQRNHEYAE